jgi:hypothetical protein
VGTADGQKHRTSDADYVCGANFDFQNVCSLECVVRYLRPFQPCLDQAFTPAKKSASESSGNLISE